MSTRRQRRFNYYEALIRRLKEIVSRRRLSTCYYELEALIVNQDIKLILSLIVVQVHDIISNDKEHLSEHISKKVQYLAR